jgi:hypothetical protein
MRYFVATLFAALIYSCSSPVQSVVDDNGKGVLIFIEAAVSDFSSRNFKENEGVTYSVTTKFVNQDLVVVSLYGSIGKMIVTPERGYEVLWGNRYIERGGRLFYWREEGADQKSAISKFKEFDLIDSLESLAEAELITDHQKRSVDYYFCRSNISKFKVKRSRSLVGDYPIPKLNCQ